MFETCKCKYIKKEILVINVSFDGGDSRRKYNSLNEISQFEDKVAF
jgi:hypothetical protein